jgi:hypothetical protein
MNMPDCGLGGGERGEGRVGEGGGLTKLVMASSERPPRSMVFSPALSTSARLGWEEIKAGG